MSRMSLSPEEREARLRELEASLDDELELEAAVEAGPGSTQTTTEPAGGRMTLGKLALYGLGVLVALGLLKWAFLTLLPLIQGLLALAVLGAFGYGLVWFWRKLKGRPKAAD